MFNMKHLVKSLIAALLILTALVLVFFFFQAPPTQPVPQPTPTATPPPTPPPTVDPADDPTDDLPHDKLFITPERQHYQDNDLTLRIPILNVTRSVLNGVDEKTLLRGVGLYDYAQLPGEGNRNVSIAGHRNGLSNGQITDHAPFYYIDTLKEGDYLYLTDATKVYRYLFHDSVIVAADDWSPIYSQGYSCLTLTSCHPIGVSDHRIIVRAQLDQILDKTDPFDYLKTW